MKHFSELENLNGTVHENRDPLVEGYCLTLDGNDFCIFVANEIVGSKRGYFLKLMYENGTDEKINLSNTELFPQVNAIFKTICCGLWENHGKKRHCYKYIVFGHGVKNKTIAVTIMRQIICKIIMSTPIR